MPLTKLLSVQASCAANSYWRWTNQADLVVGVHPRSKEGVEEGAVCRRMLMQLVGVERQVLHCSQHLLDDDSICGSRTTRHHALQLAQDAALAELLLRAAAGVGFQTPASTRGFLELLSAISSLMAAEIQEYVQSMHLFGGCRRQIKHGKPFASSLE